MPRPRGTPGCRARHRQRHRHGDGGLRGRRRALTPRCWTTLTATPRARSGWSAYDARTALRCAWTTTAPASRPLWRIGLRSGSGRRPRRQPPGRRARPAAGPAPGPRGDITLADAPARWAEPGSWSRSPRARQLVRPSRATSTAAWEFRGQYATCWICASPGPYVQPVRVVGSSWMALSAPPWLPMAKSARVFGTVPVVWSPTDSWPVALLSGTRRSCGHRPRRGTTACRSAGWSRRRWVRRSPRRAT